MTTLWKEQGPYSLWRGWSGKLFGYGIQGGFRFGLYEYFEKLYSDVPVDHIRVQTQSNFAKGLTVGSPRLYRTEGLAGFYKGLLPLWGQNLPFAMVMFSTFEHSVYLIHDNVLQRKKHECTRVEQLAATCLAGYTAGAIGTVVSNPAYNIVSSLYNKKADNILQAV
ncbi:Mitochondrial phosphate carrier protein 1, mitochondrial-like protein [Drosera capensis]